MSDPRYQFQPWRVKAWRNVVHRPVQAVRFAWLAARWVLHGCPRLYLDDFFPRMTRAETFRHLWRMENSRAHMRMRHYWSVEECMDRLREKTDA